MVIDMDTNKTTTVIDPLKSYFVVDTKELLARLYPGNMAVPDLQDTGRTDTIAGHRCAIWTTPESELCLGEGVPFFPVGPLQAFAHPLATHKTGIEGRFPFRGVLHDPGGRERMRLEVVSLEAKKAPEATFAIPSGYKVMASPIASDPPPE
jgi:hypothetical protein